MLDRLFTEHPRSVGESYGEHLMMAGGFGARMILGGLACLVHAIIPALFTRTGSRIIAGLYGKMIAARGAKKHGSPFDLMGGLGI